MEIFASEENTVLISINGDFMKVWKEHNEQQDIEDFIIQAKQVAMFANGHDEYHFAKVFLTMLHEVFEVETEIVEIETFLDLC